MDAILKVQNLIKYYGKKENITRAVDGISLEVERGEFIGIMGASGSGKTTFLNCISTIDTATSGHILIDHTDVTEMNPQHLSRFRRKKLGFIFQDFNLLDTLTAYENIALALTILKTPPSKIDEKVRAGARLLDVESILEKFPYQISGGQKQRIAAVRAMVTEPALVLADEPTGALDSKAAHNLLESFTTLNQEKNATILMVTHDAFSASYCKRIILIRDGKIWNEIIRKNETQKDFFERIMNSAASMGGDMNAE